MQKSLCFRGLQKARENINKKTSPPIQRVAIYQTKAFCGMLKNYGSDKSPLQIQDRDIIGSWPVTTGHFLFYRFHTSKGDSLNWQLVFEIIGYVASVLIAISLMMKSILKLRIINLVGAICFTIYGLTIKAYPIAAVNGFIILIDLYYLYEMFNTKEYFSLLEVQKDSDYLEYFLKFYSEEIKKFLPGFVYSPTARQQVFFVLRNMVPAGLFIAENYQDRGLFVKLDFVIPGYRDFKVGHFVYREKAEVFLRQGIEKIYSAPGNKSHAQYLLRMGFQPDPATNNALYCLSLKS